MGFWEEYSEGPTLNFSKVALICGNLQTQRTHLFLGQLHGGLAVHTVHISFSLKTELSVLPTKKKDLRSYRPVPPSAHCTSTSLSGTHRISMIILPASQKNNGRHKTIGQRLTTIMWFQVYVSQVYVSGKREEHKDERFGS